MNRPNERQNKPSYLATTKGGKRVMIRHKHHCQHWQGKACDCDPEYLPHRDRGHSESEARER